MITKYADLLLADIRAARVPGDRTGLNGRQLELASGRAAARPGEPVPVAAALAPVLRAAEAAQPGLLADLVEAVRSLPDPDVRLLTQMARRMARPTPLPPMESSDFLPPVPEREKGKA